MKSVALFYLFIILGCASSPTKYENASDDKSEGYTDKVIDEKLRLATFKGNSSTDKDTAELYAKFRAIETCSGQSSPKLAHILLVKDKTFEKQITQTTTTSPYYGVSPYYGSWGAYRGGMGVGIGYSTVSTQAKNETYTYPVFEVYYECDNHPIDARMSYKVLSGSQVQQFVKDVKGAVQIEEILPDSPNRNKLKVADIIIKANGTRVGNILELYKVHRNTKDKKLNVEILRDGVKKNVEVTFLDVTEMVTHSQQEIIKEACRRKDLKDKHALCK